MNEKDFDHKLLVKTGALKILSTVIRNFVDAITLDELSAKLRPYNSYEFENQAILAMHLNDAISLGLVKLYIANEKVYFKTC